MNSPLHNTTGGVTCWKPVPAGSHFQSTDFPDLKNLEFSNLKIQVVLYHFSVASSRSHAQNRKLFTALTKLPKCEYCMPWGSWKCPRKLVSLLFGVISFIPADFGHVQKNGSQHVTGPVLGAHARGFVPSRTVIVIVNNVMIVRIRVVFFSPLSPSCARAPYL